MGCSHGYVCHAMFPFALTVETVLRFHTLVGGWVEGEENEPDLACGSPFVDLGDDFDLRLR